MRVLLIGWKIQKLVCNHILISSLGVLMLTIVSCNTLTNLPSLAGDNLNLVPAQEAIIPLESLNEHSSGSTWKQFFTQREAEKLCQMLLRNRNWLRFDLSEIQQPNEVVAGSIRYLAFNRVSVKNITFDGSRQDIKLTSEIGNLAGLCILNLSINNFKGIPREVFNLNHLQTINLSNNRLQEIPAGISKLTNLNILNLYSNELITIPLEIFNLVNLTYLNLSCNQISVVQNDINNLTNLVSLDLSTNQLKLLPFKLNTLVNLRELNLAYNHIEKISPEISNLSNLCRFNLSSNQLQEIPSEVGKLTKLNYLGLYFNKLITIPIEIGSLVNLVKLELFNNQLEQFPSQIYKLIKLKELNLSNNRLKELPSEVGTLINLQRLILTKNQLGILPRELATLASLEELNISSNQLTKLPASIIPRLLRLKEKLALNNNPWQDPTYYKRRSADIRVNKKELKELRELIHEKAFPHRLLTLCIHYIKTHKQLFNLQELKNKLPTELQYFKQLLRPAYQWNETKDIICFKLIKKTNWVPFYLDFPIITPQDAELMLEEFKEEPIYHISSTCTHSENNSKEVKGEIFASLTPVDS